MGNDGGYDRGSDLRPCRLGMTFESPKLSWCWPLTPSADRRALRMIR